MFLYLDRVGWDGERTQIDVPDNGAEPFTAADAAWQFIKHTGARQVVVFDRKDGGREVCQVIRIIHDIDLTTNQEDQPNG